MFKAAVLVASMVAGCMSSLPLRYSEQCAATGMVVSGVSFSNGTSSAVATDGRVLVVAHEDDSGQTLSCRPPATPIEQCHVQAAALSGPIRADYTPGGKNFFLFVGYAAFILPGVALRIVFGIQRDGVDEEADEVFAREWRKCDAREMGSGPPGGFTP
jgi:hypothetical protein